MITDSASLVDYIRLDIVVNGVERILVLLRENLEKQGGTVWIDILDNDEQTTIK